MAERPDIDAIEARAEWKGKAGLYSDVPALCAYVRELEAERDELRVRVTKLHAQNNLLWERGANDDD